MTQVALKRGEKVLRKRKKKTTAYLLLGKSPPLKKDFWTSEKGRLSGGKEKEGFMTRPCP